MIRREGKKRMDLEKIDETNPALVKFIGCEDDYSIYDEEKAGCGNCSMCDEVPRDACIHHGAAHRKEFYYDELYLAYATEMQDGFLGIAVRNNDDELVFPRDAADFEVVEDKMNVLGLG